jgi:hypothetical protein
METLYWGELDSAAHQISVTAILNPDSGPGPSVDPNYVAAVNNLEAAGGAFWATSSLTTATAARACSGRPSKTPSHSLRSCFL